MQAIKTLATAAALLIGAASAQATLINRGGGMIYDTELNITWLQDWNYAGTSGYAAAHAGGSGTNAVYANGAMGWGAANTWANNLVYGGYDDWRLPTMVDTGTAGCNFSYAGGTDCGHNVQTKSGATVYSEMAHLYHETLGNKALCNPTTSTASNCVSQAGYGMLNVGPFSNVQSYAYWSGLEYAPNFSLAWYFYNFFGSQDFGDKGILLYAVAVRPGDVAATVPEPQTLALTTLALAAAMVVRRKRPL